MADNTQTHSNIKKSVTWMPIGGTNSTIQYDDVDNFYQLRQQHEQNLRDRAIPSQVAPEHTPKSYAINKGLDLGEPQIDRGNAQNTSAKWRDAPKSTSSTY